MSLKYNHNYIPHATFRYEENVTLGKVEMLGGGVYWFRYLC